MTSVKLWVVSVFDHSDDTMMAWVVTSEDLVIPSIKDDYAGGCDVDDLPDDLDELEVALKADGYTLHYAQQSVEVTFSTVPPQPLTLQELAIDRNGLEPEPRDESER